MSETDWGEQEPPAKKKRVPSWVWWGCGGGCLLVLLVGVIVGILAWTKAREFVDPEKVWPNVAEMLPFDERPAGWDAKGGSFFGGGMFMLEPPPALNASLIVMRFRTQGELDAMLDPDSPQNTGFLGVGKIRSPEVGKLEIQGREVRCLRYEHWRPDAEVDEPGNPGLSFDASGTGSIHVLVQILPHRTGEPVRDEEVRELLAPFDLWRGR